MGNTPKFEQSLTELIIIGLQISFQRKGIFEKALTTIGYKESRIFWDFPLRYLDILIYHLSGNIPKRIGDYGILKIPPKKGKI